MDEDENKSEGMKFYLGQTVYSAMGFKLGRYVVAEYVTTTSIEGTKLEYVLTTPGGRKEGYSEEDINKSFFETLEEAKTFACQAWEVTVQQMRDQLSTFKDEDFDEIIRKTQEAKAKREKK